MNKQQQEVYDNNIIQIVFSSLSVVACTTVLIFYFKFKELHVDAFNIIIFLIWVDLEWSLLIIISDATVDTNQNSVTLCRIIYGFQIQSGLLSIFTNTLVAIYCYLVTFSEPRYMNKILMIFLTLSALLLGFIPALQSDSFTIFDTNQCFMKPKVIINYFFIPVFLCLVCNFTFMTLTYIQLNISESNREIKKYLRRLFIYPIIIFSIFIFPFLQEIAYIFGVTQIPFWLQIWIEIVQCSLGLIDSIAYCMTAIKNELISENESNLDTTINNNSSQRFEASIKES